MIKPVVILSLIMGGIIFLTGCQNTLSGFGEDMQRAGQAIKKSVNEA